MSSTCLTELLQRCARSDDDRRLGMHLARLNAGVFDGRAGVAQRVFDVEHEPRLRVGVLQQQLPGLVDVLGRNDLDVGREPMGGAEVEHLLCLGDPADEAAADADAARDELEGFDAQLVGRQPDAAEAALGLDRRQIGVDVKVRRSRADAAITHRGRHAVTVAGAMRHGPLGACGKPALAHMHARRPRETHMRSNLRWTLARSAALFQLIN